MGGGGGWFPSMHHRSHDRGSTSRLDLPIGGSASRGWGLHPGGGVYILRGVLHLEGGLHLGSLPRGDGGSGVCIQG